MNVVVCQTDIVWEDKQANFERVRKLLESAPPPAGSLIVLPEMFATGFTMEVAKAAESPERETAEFLAAIARQYASHVIGGLVTMGPDGRGRNQSAVVSPEGRQIALYHKIQPFTNEQERYSAGDRIALVRIGEFETAPFVCYDLRFPEIFRAAARRGVELYVVIASWPVARIHHWTTLLQARAIENQAFVVGVNRTGSDPSLQYNGRSMVVGPGGEVLLDAGEEEGVFSAQIDLTALKEYRAKLPFLADIRSDFVPAGTHSNG